MEVKTDRCYILSTDYSGDLAISLDPHAFDRFLSEDHYSVRILDVPVVDGNVILYRYRNKNPFEDYYVKVKDEYGTYQHQITYVTFYGLDKNVTREEATRFIPYGKAFHSEIELFVVKK